MRISKGTALAGALGVGAALWYFYDREKGASRRAALRDGISSIAGYIPGWAGDARPVMRSESAYLPGDSTLRTGWRPSLRTVGSIAGAGLALYGVRRRGAIGRFASGLGSTMFRRGLHWRRAPEPPDMP